MAWLAVRIICVGLLTYVAVEGFRISTVLGAIITAGFLAALVVGGVIGVRRGRSTTPTGTPSG